MCCCFPLRFPFDLFENEIVIVGEKYLLILVVGRTRRGPGKSILCFEEGDFTILFGPGEII